MNHSRAQLPLGILSVLLALLPLLGTAQYSLDRYTIGGGGGTSTGGVYSVSATIGQHDAGGPLTNGQYSVTGGFWSSIAILQSPGAPRLTISYSANRAIVSWPPSVSGWTLQTNGSLGSTNWGNYLDPIVNNTVTNFPPTGNLFFRLKQP